MERYDVRDIAAQSLAARGFSYCVYDTWEYETVRVCKTRDYAEFFCAAMNGTEEDFFATQETANTKGMTILEILREMDYLLGEYDRFGLPEQWQDADDTLQAVDRLIKQALSAIASTKGTE